MSIQNQKLLYHLTCVDNLASILERGILSRSSVSDYVDVADQDIIESRQELGLENYVPFHFFGGNPFDGSVQLGHPDKVFVLITVRREHAKARNWQIIPCHPLANEEIQLMDYNEGFSTINWNKMNERDYNDELSKSVCMAECLSPGPVSVERIFGLYVASENDKVKVNQIVTRFMCDPYINVNPGMFVNK